MNEGSGDNAQHHPSSDSSPPSRTQNYFAVPRRGQLPGRAYIATPAHVRSPLAQTPSPIPSDDDPFSRKSRSNSMAQTPVSETDTVNFSASNDDSSARPSLSPLRATNDLIAATDVKPINAGQSQASTEGSSWADFLEKYAEGNWDPVKVPPQPHATGSIPRLDRRKSVSVPSDLSTDSSIRPSIGPKSPSDLDTRRSASTRPLPTGRTQSSPDSTSIDSPTIMQRRGGEQLILSNISPAPSGHFASSSSWASLAVRDQSPSVQQPLLTPHPITPDAVVDAATVRWAGARVKVAPLSLSSPERELLDPLSDYVSGLPTPQQKLMAEYFTRATGVTSKSVSNSNHGLHNASTASPAFESPPNLAKRFSTSLGDAEPAVRPRSPLASPQIPGLTNGTIVGRSTPDASTNPPDYFPKVNQQSEQTTPVNSTQNPMESALLNMPKETKTSSSSAVPTTSPISTPALSETLASTGTAAGPACAPSVGSSIGFESSQILAFATPATEVPPPPMLAQLASIAPQSSSPPRRPSPDTNTSATRPLTKTREEQLFDELGYLVAPHPPDELNRRTALHKFNILHTAPDLNFDRIAHLAKLVFHAKWVLITLVDKDEQFLKHSSGLSFNTGARDPSFCNHAILQGSEPLVVLNALEDWRFKNNPMVHPTVPPTDPSYMKVIFYAGTPLRTADGYSVGSLCVIDDVPRAEFGPRQRHTLKEFGAIIMREMELWRDKVQLRIRDRIQTSMEQFTRECLELDAPASDSDTLNPEQLMKRVYGSAATLVKDTLDLEGAVVVDVSNFEVLHTTPTDPNSDTPPTKLYHGDLFNSGTAFNAPRTSADSSDDYDTDEKVGVMTGESRYEFGKIPALPVLGIAENIGVSPGRANEPLSGEAHAKLASFLATYPDGRIYERVVPSCFKGIIPSSIQYAMVVPIFNVDAQPFVLLCGYTTDRTKHYLEGFEMQYLRAIGVVILSAVLKRRMKLADKAKSLFISNISHELRTPLHGILAAAELLADSGLTQSQQSYLQTVEACGTSLVETVNHVLDFSKLSGTTKNMSIKRTSTDLVTLLEDTVEGSWVGARARAVYGTADIGSAYSPPDGVASSSTAGSSPQIESTVETVLDIGYREEGWMLKCEKGGIRRVLMNLMGNSLKFTESGFVHITLRELPPELGSGFIKIELAVLDSGKGISKDFLKNQMFQPFSQENPLHTGTGLGLAIVNSIVKSEGIHGKVDVYSTEGVGTEIRVTIETETPSRSSFTRQEKEDSIPLTRRHLKGVRVFPVSFDESHRGQRMLRETLSSYMTDWWHVEVVKDAVDANVLLVNENIEIIEDLTQRKDISRTVILLASHRGSNELASVLGGFNAVGGRSLVVYKPCRPTQLYRALESVTTAPHHNPPLPLLPENSSLESTSRPSLRQKASLFTADELRKADGEGIVNVPSSLLDPDRRNTARASSSTLGVVPRRNSEDIKAPPRRPAISRSKTGSEVTYRSDSYHSSTSSLGSQHQQSDIPTPPSRSSKTPENPNATKIGKVLIVEDNHVNRTLLAQWLRKSGYIYEEAVDGQVAVNMFRDKPAGYYDVVLIDMSMPVLDGAGATQIMRTIESQRTDGAPEPVKDEEGRRRSVFSTGPRARIFALSGLASNEDKVRAFNAGVDGYLVKPVSFKSLSSVFNRLEDQGGQAPT